MAKGRTIRNRSNKGLYWGLFLLLPLAVGTLYLLGLSPGGLVRGIRYMISSSVSGQQVSPATSDTDPPQAQPVPADTDGNVLLRSIEKQRAELREREDNLNRLQNRLQVEKQEIVEERRKLEETRSGAGPGVFGRLSRYLPLLILLSVGLWFALVFFLVIRRAVSGRRPSGKQPTVAAAPGKMDPNLAGLKESLSRMINDVEEVAGRVPDELRQGSMALRDLIREADNRMGELKNLLSQVALISQREAAAPVAEKSAKIPRNQTGKPEVDTEGKGGGGDRNEKVYLLAVEGHSEEEIARRLGLGIGEVQLILNLKRTGDDAG